MGQLFRYAGGATPISVVGNPNFGGLPDQSTAVERGKFGGHAPHEVPGAATAGQKISHGHNVLLYVLLDVLLHGAEHQNASVPGR